MTNSINLREWFYNRIAVIWLLLVGATVVSFEFGHGIGFADQRYARWAIIAIAFLKVRYVILDFMEIRHAPRWMRVTAECWVLAVLCVLIALYW